MMFVSFNSNMVGVTCGAGTADYSRAPEFTPVYSGVRVARSLVFCFVDRCLSFWPFSFGLRFTASHYPFVIFKLFFPLTDF